MVDYLYVPTDVYVIVRDVKRGKGSGNLLRGNRKPPSTTDTAARKNETFSSRKTHP